MNIKVSGELSGILEVLKKMAMFEMTIGELYSLCANTWKEDAEFWLSIWRDEIKHAQFINQIIQTISKSPERFEKGRPFNVFSIETTLSDIRSKIEKIKKGEISKDNLLYIASDIEKGYLEDRYGEIVSTNDIEYKTLMQKVVDDTGRHKEKILNKIKELTQQKK
ncbi:MAG TPA: hypothetical protein PLR38_02295 [Syntrophorhabdaceae bacterium]|nr:hypothetical protein [Syntrophorhabdaceae bacterium]HOL04562.1 hypothetical protein [Syntrophorhabdaceae bacterium]HPP42206.1 hypothetical protein [Syntrophorhabdaceae bacterium]